MTLTDYLARMPDNLYVISQVGDFIIHNGTVLDYLNDNIERKYFGSYKVSEVSIDYRFGSPVMNVKVVEP